MRLRLPLLLVLAFLPHVFARGQAVDFNNTRLPVTDLTGPWRFHAGDDPAWSAENLDDSGWSLLSAGKSWSQQGYRNYSGVGWYRLRVTLPGSTPIAVYLPTVDESCQVFAN